MSNNKRDGGLDLKDKNKQEFKRPKKYKVILYNDDYTPMEYVVLLLIQEFHMSEKKAFSIMMSIHNSGKGIAGVYSKEIAETKAVNCNLISKNLGYPLLCDIQPE